MAIEVALHGCVSAIIGDTFDAPYTEVCGFVAGYQYNTPNAFHGKGASIESTYLDGALYLSLTVCLANTSGPMLVVLYQVLLIARNALATKVA